VNKKSTVTVTVNPNSWAYLFIELLGDAVGPGGVEVVGLGGAVDVGQLDDHLGHQEAVTLRCPVHAHTVVVTHLETTKKHISEIQTLNNQVK